MIGKENGRRKSRRQKNLLNEFIIKFIKNEEIKRGKRNKKKRRKEKGKNLKMVDGEKRKRTKKEKEK